ncbi:MAG: hypothetical protein K5644_07165 [Lachnospiraceae bacterium]|nr:hypothetical protein [Lachnospiraceae bacterium]
MKKRLLLLLMMIVLTGAVVCACSCSKKSTENSANETGTANSSNVTTAVNNTSINSAAKKSGEFGYDKLTDVDFGASSGDNWSMNIVTNHDGSFRIEEYKLDTSDTDDDYPNGTTHIVNATGKFGELEKVDEYTYKSNIQSIQYDVEDGVIVDGMRMVYSESSVRNNDMVYFYLPGKQISEISKEYIDGINNSSQLNDKAQLDFYGLFITDNASHYIALKSN